MRCVTCWDDKVTSIQEAKLSNGSSNLQKWKQNLLKMWKWRENLQKCKQIKTVKMEEDNLFLVSMSRTPVPDGHKVDIFSTRELHLFTTISIIHLLCIFGCIERIVLDLVVYTVANIVLPGIQGGGANEKRWNGQKKKNQCCHLVRKLSTVGSSNSYIQYSYLKDMQAGMLHIK